MSLFFGRLAVGYPGPLTRPPDRPNSWKIFTVWKGNVPGACTTLGDIRACESTADLKNARKSFLNFLNRAATGLPLSALYDEKQCHEAFTFKNGSNHEEVKVLRIWGTGVIRLYFLYLPDKNIVLLKTMAKREDQLTSGELKQIQDLAIEVMTCLAQHEFESRIICTASSK